MVFLLFVIREFRKRQCFPFGLVRILAILYLVTINHLLSFVNENTLSYSTCTLLHARIALVFVEHLSLNTTHQSSQYL